MLVDFARRVISSLRAKQRKRPRVPNRNSRLFLQVLETRELLAADLAITELSSDGQDLIVEYAVDNQSAGPFNVGLFASEDGINPDRLLQTERVSDPADYSMGAGHKLTLSPDFSDSPDDYYLIAIIDTANEVREVSESNNDQIYSGGVFVASDGVGARSRNRCSG